MSIENSKFEVYVVGYSNDMSYINKKYIKDILEKNNFSLCESIEIADFILSLKEWNNTNDFIFSKDYSVINYIDIAESLDDLLSLRDYYQFRESAVN